MLNQLMYTRILCYLLLLIFCCSVIDSNAVVIRANGDDINLCKGGLEYFKDSEGNLEISDFTAGDADFDFKKAEGSLILSSDYATYWVRFDVEYESEVGISPRLLEIDEGLVSFFDLYVPKENGAYKLYKAGYEYPYGYRPIDRFNFYFPLPVHQEKRVYYAQVRTGNSAAVNFNIIAPDKLINLNAGDNLFMGVYYGIIILLFLYNIISYWRVGTKDHMIYILYLLATALMGITYKGHGFRYFWPNIPVLNWFLNQSVLIFFAAGLYFFTTSFLELRDSNKRGLKALSVVFIVYAVAHLLNVIFIKTDPYFIIIIPFSVFLSIILFVSIVSLRQGRIEVRYFIAGVILLLLRFLFLILVHFKMVDINSEDGDTLWQIILRNSFQLGVVLTSLGLAWALSEKYSGLKKQREKDQESLIKQLEENARLRESMNQNLKLEVAQRTSELQEANHDLELQASELERVNQLLLQDNESLRENIQKAVQITLFKESIDFEQFSQAYPDKESCLEYLASLKWSKGYRCKRCNNETYISGKEQYGRRCSKCGYDESASVDSLFYHLKIPLNKAFYIAFLSFANNGNISAAELSKILGVGLNTCYAVNKRVKKAMALVSENSDQRTQWEKLLLIDPLAQQSREI